MIRVEIIPNFKFGKYDLKEEDLTWWQMHFRKEYSPHLEEIEKEGVIFTIYKEEVDEVSVGYKNGSPELKEKLYRRSFRNIDPVQIELVITQMKKDGTL